VVSTVLKKTGKPGNQESERNHIESTIIYAKNIQEVGYIRDVSSENKNIKAKKQSKGVHNQFLTLGSVHIIIQTSQMYALQSRTKQSTRTRLTMGTISLIRYTNQRVYLVSNTLRKKTAKTDHNKKYTNQQNTQDIIPQERAKRGRQNPIRCGKCNRLGHSKENCYSKTKILIITDTPTKTEGYNTKSDKEVFYSDICTIIERSDNSRYYIHSSLSHNGRNLPPTIQTNKTALKDSGANCTVVNKRLISDSIGLTQTQTKQADGTVMSSTF
jgi:hypothetical protein